MPGTTSWRSRQTAFAITFLGFLTTTRPLLPDTCATYPQASCRASAKPRQPRPKTLHRRWWRSNCGSSERGATSPTLCRRATSPRPAILRHPAAQERCRRCSVQLRSPYARGRSSHDDDETPDAHRKGPEPTGILRPRSAANWRPSPSGRCRTVRFEAGPAVNRRRTSPRARARANGHSADREPALGPDRTLAGVVTRDAPGSGLPSTDS